MRSQDAAIREYARTGLPRESRATIEALIARLDTFLLMPGTEALSTSRCVNIAKALSSPGEVVILDPSNPPAGAERVARFWAATLVGLVSRAILTREVGPESLPVWFVAEEIQEGLTRSQSGLLGRLLSTARSRRVGLFLTTQHRSALTKVEPTLVQSIMANVALQLQFRTSLEDAKAFAHALPQSTDERKERQLRRGRIAELTRLPRRMAYLWVRSAGLRAQLIRTPRIDLDALHEHADRLDSRLREELRRGLSAVLRSEPAQASPTRQVPLDPFGGALDYSHENGAGSKDELPTLG
jgi:hypothetical protein